MQTIVEAGFTVLLRHGSAGFTTRNIAATAGVGVGSVYEYFPDKQAIRAAMHEQLLADVQAVIRADPATRVRLPPRELILHLLADFRRLLQANHGRYAAYLATLTQTEMRAIAPRLGAALSQMTVQYALWHPELIGVRRLPVVGYIAIHGGLAVLGQHLSENPPLLDFDDLAEGLADMVEAMLRSGAS